jgi:hypothetical protein
MRKFFLTILAFVYITSSIGATIHMHYCMGKLANWDIGQNISKTCGKCGMDKADEKNNGCCKDEKKFVKNIADQKTGEAGFELLQVFAASMPIEFIELPIINFSSVTIANPFGHSPLRSSGVAVYIRNCVFLI